jgi:hypothetical protein
MGRRDGVYKLKQWKVRFLRKGHLGQGGFSRLAGAKDGHHRILTGGPDQFFCDVSSDHGVMIFNSCAKSKSKIRFTQLSLHNRLRQWRVRSPLSYTGSKINENVVRVVRDVVAYVALDIPFTAI